MVSMAMVLGAPEGAWRRGGTVTLSLDNVSV